MKRQLSRPIDRADLAREKILRAAIHHFSKHGLAGARTDAIAQSAEVNKALLYYYFKSKNNLYTAALEEVSRNVMGSALAALELGKSPGESFLRLVLNHFDRILTKREFQSLMQQELVRFHRGETETMQLFVNSVFARLLARMQEVIRQGIRTGELCDVDWLQIIYAGLGANVFYFFSAPMMRFVLPFEPLDPAALKARRKQAIQFLGVTLFQDRSHGARLAKVVLASTPMPKIPNFSQDLSIHRRCS